MYVTPLLLYPPGCWTKRIWHSNPCSREDLLPSCGECTQTPAINHFKICLYSGHEVMLFWGSPCPVIEREVWVLALSAVCGTLCSALLAPDLPVGLAKVLLVWYHHLTYLSNPASHPFFSDVDLYSCCIPNSISVPASRTQSVTLHSLPLQWLQLKFTKFGAISVQT